MVSVLFLNPSITEVARAVVCMAIQDFRIYSHVSHRSLNPGPLPQLLQLMHNAEKTPGPISSKYTELQPLVGTSLTVDCLQSANSLDVLEGLLQAMEEMHKQLLNLTFDSAYGIFPDLPSQLLPRGQFAQLPFIASTNLDEGILFLVLPMKG